ncbi:hypothetical protein [Methanoculleus sp.]|uniref:hypothetical protein n=1 Tax=Methanoculleus sp. TaxID=90427 RepID=UPI002FCC568D
MCGISGLETGYAGDAGCGGGLCNTQESIRDVKRSAPGRESRSAEKRAGFAITLIVVRES